MSGTNRKAFPGTNGPLLGSNRDPSLGQTGPFLFNSTVRSPFCPFVPGWDGSRFVPGTIVPQGPSEKYLCVLCLLVYVSSGKKKAHKQKDFVR